MYRIMASKFTVQLKTFRMSKREGGFLDWNSQVSSLLEVLRSQTGFPKEGRRG